VTLAPLGIDEVGAVALSTLMLSSTLWLGLVCAASLASPVARLKWRDPLQDPP
jgi:hypothetical protein